MSDQDQEKGGEHLPRAYEQMLERARGFLERTRRETLPTLRQSIDEARERAVELGELTREEADHVGEYLHRDLEEAAAYLSYTGKGLADWLHLDIAGIEARFYDSMSVMVDHTRLELDRLAAEARAADERRTGQLTGPGALECSACGRHLHFHESGHIPPCPDCRGTVFRRAAR